MNVRFSHVTAPEATVVRVFCYLKNEMYCIPLPTTPYVCNGVSENLKVVLCFLGGDSRLLDKQPIFYPWTLQCLVFRLSLAKSSCLAGQTVPHLHVHGAPSS